MTKLGSDLVESAAEALAIARREARPAGAFDPEPVAVAAIRRRLGLSQGKFARRFNSLLLQSLLRAVNNALASWR
ncbi:MAG: hypothetical protein ACLPN5_03720 [Roseiarcus sp.]